MFICQSYLWPNTSVVLGLAYNHCVSLLFVDSLLPGWNTQLVSVVILSMGPFTIVKNSPDSHSPGCIWLSCFSINFLDSWCFFLIMTQDRSNVPHCRATYWQWPNTGTSRPLSSPVAYMRSKLTYPLTYGCIYPRCLFVCPDYQFWHCLHIPTYHRLL